MIWKITFLIILLPFITFGQTVTWDGGGGNTNWHNPLNWDTNTVPCKTCTAVVDGAVVVNISANDTIKELRVDNGAFFFIGTNVILGVQGGSVAIVVEQSQFTNNGILRPSGFTNFALLVSSNSEFDNFGSVEIIGNFIGTSQGGIRVSNSQFNNQNNGTVGIANLSSDPLILVLQADLINSGEMLITNCTAKGLIITANSNFENLATGNLDINNTQSYGIENSGNLLNRGDITLSDILVSGTSVNAIGLVSNGNFTNTIGAHFSISYTVFYGMNISGNFENEGDILVEYNLPSTIGPGIGINSAATFTNSGNINVENISGIGFYSSDNLQPNCELVNHGSISINETSNIALQNLAPFENHGTISINNSNGLSGLNNADSLINNGILTISNSSSRGLINTAYFENQPLGEISISFSGSNAMGNFTNGKIVNAGSLQIDNANQESIVNNDIFSNVGNGSIHIRNLFKTGIINSGTFENLGGSLLIEDFEPSGTNADGIYNNGILKNNSSISIKKSLRNGIKHTGASASFLNDINGKIYIQDAGNSGVFLEKDAENRGEIHVDSSLYYGFYFNAMSSTFLNQGELKINNTSISIFAQNGFLGNTGSIDLKQSIYGINNIGQFYNFPAGKITIDSCDIYGINTVNEFNNEGVVKCTNINGNGIIANGIFRNYKSIECYNINGTSKSGLVINNNSTSFTNFKNGKIYMHKSEFGITSDDTLINYGTILIDSVNLRGINNSSLIENYGLIESSHSNILLLNNSTGVLNNKNSGILTLSYGNNRGISNFGEVDNEGEININNVPKGLVSTNKLVNSHKINISKTTDLAFSLDYSNVPSYNLNKSSGDIKIDSSSGNAANITRTFINEGKLLINNTDGSGLIFSNKANSGPDSLKNYGLIEIVNATMSIWNTSSTSDQDLFLNQPKGVIRIDNYIQNFGPFKNEGLIHQNSSTFNSMNYPFQNIGAFVDVQDIQNPYSSFINTGLLIKPLKGEVSVGIKEMNIVNRSGVTTFSPESTWYINPILSVPGGTFSAIDDSYTPNANTPFADTLYFNVSTASITRHVKIPILKTPVCSANPTATFTQAVSTDWHTAANWNTGSVPDYCTIAIIPNTKQCTITTGRKARAYRILSDTGSVFDAELGVVLEVVN